MNRISIIGVALVVGTIAILVFAMTAHKPAIQQNTKAQVATSFYPLYFFASEIGGDRAEVSNITPAGAEPHDYEPTAQQIAQIENSEFLIIEGSGLEPWGDTIQQNINPARTLVISVGEGLTTQKVTEDGEEITDPHVWLSPRLAQEMVDKIQQGFAKADPVNEEYYASRTQILKQQLADLDTEYRLGLSLCAKKDIITSHAAFGYLASAYHLNQVPISGLSPDAEPSAKQLAEVANFAKKNNVKFIFFENLVSPKLSQTIATEVGAQTMVLDPIEGIPDEDLIAGKNYMSVMRNNLANLRIALQCQ